MIHGREETSFYIGENGVRRRPVNNRIPWARIDGSADGWPLRVPCEPQLHPMAVCLSGFTVRSDDQEPVRMSFPSNPIHIHTAYRSPPIPRLSDVPFKASSFLQSLTCLRRSPRHLSQNTLPVTISLPPYTPVPSSCRAVRWWPFNRIQRPTPLVAVGPTSM
ncbi:hypothetical protein HPP92_009261 [Vanilla planifolia]|uniref:Uncharacterized protein n=1 Tax=Vanilla planifolia TaxID=51239 RepID=A0A835V8P6_VANPL|nr:hypothetical protein HPP92_009261 [Vanilla planifolia]